jgi:hypothetical protein
MPVTALMIEVTTEEERLQGFLPDAALRLVESDLAGQFNS